MSFEKMSDIIELNRRTTGQIQTWANNNEKKVNELREKIKKLEKEKKVLEEQIKQKDEWFEEINEILGVDKDEPAVEMVRDYVQKN